MFGKSVTDLQTGVSVGNAAITGTLHNITGYTGFSSKTEQQSGHYLAIHASSEDADSITVELVGGTSGPVTLDEDGIIVLLIADKDTQSVRVIATKGSATKTLNYSLTGVTLEA